MTTANYNIWVGVPSYEAHYVGTLRNVTYDYALSYAEELMREEYENIAGLHGIPSYNDIYEELIEYYAAELESGEYDESDIEYFATEQYEEEINNWGSYYAHDESGDQTFYECYDDSKKFYLN